MNKMFFEQSCEIESLLNPIDSGAETGVDLRENRTAEFNDLRDARRAASKAERDTALDPDRQNDAVSHWQQIEQLAPTILQSQSKDLEVACCFTEAQSRLHGIAGLRSGLDLILQLISRYWSTLYPAPDEDGTEPRVQPLMGLFGGETEGTLVRVIKDFPITPAGAGKGAVDTFVWWQYDLAVQVSRIEDPRKKAQRTEQLGYSLDDIQAAVATAPAAFYVQQVNHAEAIANILVDLQALLFDIKQSDKDLPMPSVNAFGELIRDQFLNCLKHLAGSKLGEPDRDSKSEITDSEEISVHAQEDLKMTELPGAASRNSFANASLDRAEALARIVELAQFFRETEPHTPMAGALERVARWGKMPVDELMRELLPSEQARQVYGQLTGIDLNGIPAGPETSDTGEIAPPERSPTSTASPKRASDGW